MRFSWVLITPLLFLPNFAFSQDAPGWRETVTKHAVELTERSHELFEKGVQAATEASRQAQDWTAETLTNIGQRVAPAYDRTVEAVSEHSNALREQTVSALSDAYGYSADASNEIYQSLSQNAAAGARFLLEVGHDGALQIYEASADGMSDLAGWSQDRFAQLQEVDYCQLDLMDAAGGFTAGVAVTSLFSGVNLTGASLIAIPTMSGWLPVLAPLTSAAIPAGVTLAAGAGVLIYASSKGYCWMIAPTEVEVENDMYDTEPPVAEAID